MIEEIDDPDELVEKSADLSWQDFERLVGEIAGEHGYAVDVNVVETSPNKRAQFDVLVEMRDMVLSIDCKHWDRDRHKRASLAKAVDEHLKRSEYLAEQRCTPVAPVVVTLYNECLGVHKGVPVVPLNQLNSFLLNIDSIDGIRVFEPEQQKLV